jgi:predicted GNAT family acetyltransferase
MEVAMIATTHHPNTDATRGTFDLSVDGQKAGYLDYHLPDAKTMVVEYVEIDPARRGRGLGQQLVGAAVDWARAHQRGIEPWCSYARAVIARTAEFQDVLAK